MDKVQQMHAKRTQELREEIKQLAKRHVTQYEKQLLFWKQFYNDLENSNT